LPESHFTAGLLYDVRAAEYKRMGWIPAVSRFGGLAEVCAAWQDGQHSKSAAEIGEIGDKRPERKNDTMTGQQVNRVSSKVLIVLSLTALLAVLNGYAQPPQPDKGTAAHFFQLSIVALVPMLLLFVDTAD